MSVPPESELLARCRQFLDDTEHLHTAIVTDAERGTVFVDLHIVREHPSVAGAVVSKERFAAIRTGDGSDTLLGTDAAGTNRRVPRDRLAEYVKFQRLAWGRFEGVVENGTIDPQGETLVLSLVDEDDAQEAA